MWDGPYLYSCISQQEQPDIRTKWYRLNDELNMYLNHVFLWQSTFDILSLLQM